MARPNYKQCVERAFHPLIAASQRTDLAASLTTAPLSNDDKESQFEKFKLLKSLEISPIFLPNGGFVFPFRQGNSVCVAVSSYSDISDIHENLDDFLSEHLASVARMDPSTFLFLSYYAHGYLRLQPNFQTKKEAEDVIDIIEDGYIGHDIYDLMSYYQNVYVVIIPEESLISMSGNYSIAIEILARVSSLRSIIIDDEFSAEIHKLLAYPCIDPEKIFLSLVSTRWRYVFLELYRCLEAILYVPWMKEIQSAISTPIALRDLYFTIRFGLNWKENKSVSFEKMFEGFPDDSELLELEKDIDLFFDLTNRDDFSRKWIGKRINKIRNQLVHHEDSDDQSVLEVSEESFRKLCIYLATFADKFCMRFDHEIRSARQEPAQAVT